MILSEMVDSVKAVIQDSFFDDDYIIGVINRGMLRVSGGMKRPDSFMTTQPLPDLYTIGTVVTTTTNKVILPTNYQRALVLASNAYRAQLQIYDSFQEFAMVYPQMDFTGPVYHLGVKGRYLYYQGIPTIPETITIHYHRYPAIMASDNDEPDGLPPGFHYQILVNFACAEIYRLKEDGIDGNDFNTQRYTNLLNLALIELDATLPADGQFFTTVQGPRRY
jgi:hypothetical protein